MILLIGTLTTDMKVRASRTWSPGVESGGHDGV